MIHTCVQSGRILRLEGDLAKLEAKQREHHEQTFTVMTTIAEELARVQSEQAKSQAAMNKSINKILGKLAALAKKLKK